MINNFMKTMNEFLIGLLEDIPVGIKNEELWLDYLRNNFKNPKQLFVTFVSVDKVGLNPKSQYDTPIGVYTYPLEYVFDEEDVPFRGDDSEKSSKIKVLKQLSNKVLSNDLGDAEYQSKIKQIKNIIKTSGKYVPEIETDPDKFIERWEDAARKQTNFGCLWNVTRMLTMDYYSRKNSRKIGGPTKNNPIVWTKLLLELGYDLVIDNDTGTIHPNEPTQAVFLNPKSYKVVGEEFVDTESRYIKSNKNVKTDLIKQIEKGWTEELIENILKLNEPKYLKISNDKDFGALSYTIRIKNFKLFEKISKYFKKELNDDFVDYFNRSLNMLKKDDTKNEFVDYFIKLNNPKITNSPLIPSSKLINYLNRSETKFNNKEHIIKKLDVDLNDLDKLLK